MVLCGKRWEEEEKNKTKQNKKNQKKKKKKLEIVRNRTPNGQFGKGRACEK